MTISSRNSDTKPFTYIWDYFDLNLCIKKFKIIKDKCDSVGAIIHNVEIQKVEQI